ncbi:MAG: phenylacetic acid degradation protein PaaD, partial [Alphaproteobacteria bacterium]|nr:phenylacetic acid degradation protein PaaD [Alphaproteobacteria bacterium]
MGGEQAEKLAKAVGLAIYQKDHAVRAMGIVLEDIGPGRAR